MQRKNLINSPCISISKPTFHLKKKRANKRKHGSFGCALLPDGQLDLSIAAMSPIYLLDPCCPLISISSCIYHSNLLDERGVSSMVICPYCSRWLELLPNITKLHQTSFSKHTEPKNKIKWEHRLNQPFSTAFDAYSHNLICVWGSNCH